MPGPDRDRLHLHPEMRTATLALEGLLRDRGLPFVFHEGFRGRARQTKGRKRGTSKAGWLASWHNYGLANDFVGDEAATGKNPWDKSLPWAEYGQAVRDVGLRWSGDWPDSFELVHADMSTRHRLADVATGSLVDGLGVVDGLAEWLRWWLPIVADDRPGVGSAQRLCIRLGFDPGPIDGLWGRLTSAAVTDALDSMGLHPQTTASATLILLDAVLAS